MQLIILAFIAINLAITISLRLERDCLKDGLEGEVNFSQTGTSPQERAKAVLAKCSPGSKE